MGVWGHRTPLFCIFEMPMMKSENGILKIASPRVGGHFHKHTQQRQKNLSRIRELNTFFKTIQSKSWQNTRTDSSKRDMHKAANVCFVSHREVDAQGPGRARLPRSQEEGARRHSLGSRGGRSLRGARSRV